MDPKLPYLRVSDETTLGEGETKYSKLRISPIRNAIIDWSEQGLPRSREYGDLYFSVEGGLEESRYVFLDSNQLESRLKSCSRFVISELGFGSGLNFLATLELWKECRRKGAFLHYISFEKHPLLEDDQRRILSSWPELSNASAALLNKIPPAIPGFHNLEFYEENLKLTLVYGDVRQYLPRTYAVVDAWYLDGFAPARNKDMWGSEVFHAIAERSRRGTSFSTFSAARRVREGLEEVGFAVSSQSGFGRKRDMLHGQFLGTGNRRFKAYTPKFQSTKSAHSRKALVIGGGIAGCSIAESLARRGWRVVLSEEKESVAAGASGNPRAVLSPHFGIELNYPSRFYLTAFVQALQNIERLKSAGSKINFQQCGALQLATSKRVARLLEKLTELSFPNSFVTALSREEARKACGMAANAPGLWFPQGGWVDPHSYCSALIGSVDGRVDIERGTRVSKIQRYCDTWQAFSSRGDIVTESDVVIFANSWRFGEFSELAWLPIEKVRGQLHWNKACAVSKRLKSIVSYEGYILPVHASEYLVGASFEHDSNCTNILENQYSELHAKLVARIPEFSDAQLQPVGAKVSFRAMSPDRLPMVGAVPMYEGFEDAYRMMNNGLHGKVLPEEYCYPGMYMSLAHGSRGFVTSSISAELIAALIENEPRPLGSDLISALHPGRFLAREIRRSSAESLRKSSLKFADLDMESAKGS